MHSPLLRATPRIIVFTLVVLGAAPAPRHAVAGPPVTFTHGVATGEVTPIGAVLWTRVDQEAVLTAEVSTNPAFGTRTLTRTAVASADNDFTVKVLALPLEPATRHFFRWRHGASGAA